MYPGRFCPPKCPCCTGSFHSYICRSKAIRDSTALRASRKSFIWMDWRRFSHRTIIWKPLHSASCRKWWSVGLRSSFSRPLHLGTYPGERKPPLHFPVKAHFKGPCHSKIAPMSCAPLTWAGSSQRWLCTSRNSRVRWAREHSRRGISEKARNRTMHHARKIRRSGTDEKQDYVG